MSRLVWGISIALMGSLAGAANAASGKIIHDAEYYILEAQHGERRAVEDKELDAKLAELRKKFGTPPNVIHIMWDDTAVGEVGIPAIQKVRGFETPNINRLAAEGINFMRMYTEPSSRRDVWLGNDPPHRAPPARMDRARSSD